MQNDSRPHQMMAGSGILRRSGALTAAIAFSALSQFVVVWYMARYRGLVFLGAYNLIGTWIDLVEMVYISSMQPLIIRTVARASRPGGSFVSTSLVAAILLGSLFALLLGILSLVLGYTAELTTATFIGGMMLVPLSIRCVGEMVSIAYRRTRYVVLLSFSQSVLQLVLLLLALRVGSQLSVIFAILTLTTVLVAVAYLWLLARWVRPESMRTDRPSLVAWFRSWWPFAAVGILTTSSRRLDVPILAKLGGLYSVGVYSVALKLMTPFLLPRPAIFQTLFSWLVELLKGSRQRGLYLVGAFTRLLSVLLSFGSLVVMGFVGIVVSWLYGPTFGESAATLQIIIWGVVGFYTEAIMVGVLLAEDREKTMIGIHGVNLVFLAVASPILVTTLGAPGMALIYVAVRTLLMLQFCIALRKKYPELDFGKMFFGPLALALFAGIPLYCLMPGIPPVLQPVAGMSAGLFYIAAAVAVGFVRRDDLLPWLQALGQWRLWRRGKDEGA
jgi:O-antigen/teichoic acid export membrane protein